MSLPSINFLHLTVSEIQPGQTISRPPARTPARPDARPPDHPDTMGENNTPTAIKGCGVKTIVISDIFLFELNVKILANKFEKWLRTPAIGTYILIGWKYLCICPKNQPKF